jgi:hypothetical protein
VNKTSLLKVTTVRLQFCCAEVPDRCHRSKCNTAGCWFHPHSCSLTSLLTAADLKMDYPMSFLSINLRYVESGGTTRTICRNNYQMLRRAAALRALTRLLNNGCSACSLLYPECRAIRGQNLEIKMESHR